MTSEEAARRSAFVTALLLFPPKVRASVLDEGGLRTRFGLAIDAAIRIKEGGAEFRRSDLFAAARQVLVGTVAYSECKSRDGLEWKVTRHEEAGIVVRRDDSVVHIAECACLAPSAEIRLRWFDTEIAKHAFSDRRLAGWREIVADRPVEDEELGRLVEEFRLTPEHVAASVREHLRLGSFGADDLVPADLRYFDRLVGEPGAVTSCQDFVSGTVRLNVHQLVEGHKGEGFRWALLLSAHSGIPDLVDLGSLSPMEVAEAFQWVADHGDQISQLGAIECGLRHLAEFPEVESPLLKIASGIVADDPDNRAGSLHLCSSLIVFVEAELARTRIARLRPPFWRRLASIAHASMIEREIRAAGLNSEELAEWALSNGRLYYIQTLTDLRVEPRWFPDLISPHQLKAEFAGRIVAAAERYRSNLSEGGLRSILLGSEPPSILKQREVPAAFLPGPLEGGMEAMTPVPPELDQDIRARLSADELSETSFVGLVNCALMFKIDSELSALAALGLRRVGYQLRRETPTEDPFPLLHGLAKVAAVTRSQDLGREVRVLVRAARRADSRRLSPSKAAVVALVAAASCRDESLWADFVGDWLTELAFVDMTQEEGTVLQRDLSHILHLQPGLWETCGRGVAALEAFLASFPEAPVDRRE